MTVPGPDASLVEEIAARGTALRRRIEDCTDREVTVVCVTKAHPVGVAAAAVAAGFMDLGENYAQELGAKAEALAGTPGLRWHFIGRLQRNKVRQVAPVVDLWHSVDRESVAAEIARRAPGARVLVQVDLAGLGDRGGCAAAEVPVLVERCRTEGLAVEGLMGVGPPGIPEDARPGFRLLDAMAADLGLRERSMGMSADLEVAVEEGATMVRVGSDLVGPRTNQR